MVFLITLLFTGCPRARADPSIEISGATGFGVFVAGVTSARFAISPSASLSVRGERGFFVARDIVSFLDKGGGWQVARANLEFTHKTVPGSATTWYCAFTIGMPLRTAGMGKISASRAASISVEITEDVGNKMEYSLPQGIFCENFILQTRAAFKSTYPLLGATVTK